MKAQVLILSLFLGLLTTQAFAGNNNNNPQQSPEKKTAKPKYDFNIFKFFSVPSQPQIDSLKNHQEPAKKSILFTRKEHGTPVRNGIS